MKRIALCLTAMALIVIQGPFAQSQEKAQPAPKRVELPVALQTAQMADLIKILESDIEMKDFQIPMKLKEAVYLISDKFAAKGKELPIILDQAAFKAEDPEAPDPYEALVRFPGFPKKLSAAEALKVAIAQVPGPQATFLIRKGTVIITTRTKASIKSLLQERVLASVHEKPLALVVYALADQTGADIVIDARVGDKALTPVTANFGHTSTLESALTILADTADLKMVVVGESIYITSPENADKLSKSAKK